MHLVILFEFPTLHGGERSLLAVIDELRRQGIAAEFTAFAPPAGPLAEALAARQIPHVPWSVRDAANRRRPSEELETTLLAGLQSLRPDLVHANSLAMGRLLGRIADRLPVPCTTHLRDIIGLSTAAIADLNRLERLFAVSAATRQFHVAQGLDASRTVVIHNGIDLKEFAPRPATGHLHQEMSLPYEVRLIAAIGQIGLRKGWDVLATALERIPPNDLHLLLIGERHSDKGESRQYETDLRRQFRDGGWEDHVHWLGTRADVPRISNELDLLVHPAKQEPLGRVLIEALASGVPIVATDVGGTAEIIELELSGRLVPPNDPEKLAAAISEVLADPDLSDRFRRESRRRAEQHFDIRSAAKNLWSLWQDLRD